MKRNPNREFEEKPAQGVKGCLLYDCTRHIHFFRVYDKENGVYEDYDLCSEDIDVMLLGDSCSLFRTKKGGKLDWSSKTLGRKIAPGEPLTRMKIKNHKPVKDKDGKFVVEHGTYDENLKWKKDVDNNEAK